VARHPTGEVTEVRGEELRCYLWASCVDGGMNVILNDLALFTLQTDAVTYDRVKLRIQIKAG
jgi:hypothetical protein